MLKKLLIVSLLVACVVCLQESQGASDLRKAQSSAHSFLKFTKDQVAGLVGSKDPKSAKRDISDICPVFNCAKNGASCAPVLSKKPIIAYICTEGFCDEDTTACTAYKANGTNCDEDEQCQSSYCLQGRCAEPPSYPNPGDIGDACEQNGDCYSLNCTNKVCVGKGLGDQCESDSECNEGLWCSKPSESDKSGTCAGPIPEGSACRMQHSGSCTEGTFCGLKDNKLVCISKFSTTVGSTCVDDMDCPDLTYCDYSKSTDDTQYGSCANGPTMSSNKLCNSSSACTTFESCKCNVLIGKRTCQLNYADVSVNPTGARTAIQNAYNCYFQKCSGKFDSACLTQTCNKEFCDYIDFSITNAKVRMLQYSPKCLVDTLADQLRDIGGGFFSGICPAPTGNPTEAPAVIQSVSLVVAGSCGDANSATIRAALTSQFSVKGDIKCTNMQTSRKRAVKSVSAQYTASLSTAISSDAATSQLAAASAQMQTQGVTVIKAESSAQASQPDQVNTSPRVLIGVLSLLCVFIALI